MKSFLRILLLVAVISLPVMALAVSISDLTDAFDQIILIINKFVIPLIIGLGGLYFMWGVVQYVTAGDSEEKRDSGRSMMVYGIVALFVMISVWGLVYLLAQTFELEETLPTEEIPSTPTY